MREIEIKATLKDGDALRSLLANRGVTLSQPVTQDDRVYGLPGERGDDINQVPWLRIRTEQSESGRTTIVTLKKTVTNQLDSIEHETEVSDADEMTRIISHLGFVPYVTLKKTRQRAHIGDIEVCIDDVEGLGQFIEAEKLTGDDADYEAVIDELWQVCESLGIVRADAVTDGYDVLVRKKEGIA